MTARTRVLLADGHALVRAGVRAVLQSIPHVEVVAEAADGHEALELIRARRPHVAVVAVGLPRLNGIALAKRVRQEEGQVRIVLLTMHAHREYVRQALQAGVSAVLLKEAAPRELRLAIDAALRGEPYLGPSIAREMPGGPGTSDD